ncbi:MAG: molybdopterin-dependent oxidoreductase [Burkholderiales bacterium]|nr:molybdopterin-dependent oxidoreductase [Burkholderiales bacterium]
MNEPVEPGLAAEAGAIAFRLNGVARVVAASPASRLSDVLRESLGLTGTKVGCNAGDCGACTVLIDGRQVCACLTALGQVAGRDVTTVEGIARDGALDRLQRAFHAHGAAQCGICTPGMLMAATDLLARNERPSESEVCDALGGVLCRCTGYRKIVDAVLAAAAGEVALAVPAAGRAVGSRAPKTDGAAKLTGAERYGADRWPPGALWLRAVRSPHAHARFSIGDLAALRARHPGLLDVLTARDVPENSFGIFPDHKDQPVLADGLARFRGEAVAALVGEYETVMRIDEAELPIRWEPLEARTEIGQALAATDAPIHAARPDNVLIRGRVARGDVDAALAQAAFVAEGEFATSLVEHAYIEPEAGYAERVGDRLRIFACTQTPYMDRDEVARVLGVAPAQVHVVPSAVGGGFGGKLDVSVQPLLALAAWKLGRPVRTAYTRPESMASTSKRHPARMRARFGCDRDGRIVGAEFHGDFNTGAYASWGTTVANRVPIHAAGPYVVPNVRATTRAIYTNGPIAGAFRGFGVPQSTIAHEALLDELAERAGIDRLELRHRNALRAGQPTPTGQVLRASCGLAQCLEALRPRWRAAVAAAEAFNREQAARGGDAGRRRGVGIACMWYGIGNTVIANPSAMRVSLRKDGQFVLYNGAVDIGQGSNTILAQIAADALGVRLDAIDYVMGDTDLTEDAGKTSASRQTFVSGNAARLAAAALRRKLLQRLEVGENAELAIERGELVGIEGGRRSAIPLAYLPADARGDVEVGRGEFNPPTVPLDADGQGEPYATYGFAAQLAELEVDLALGTVHLLGIAAAHDVGRAINPTQVEGQIHGGIAQGIGLALMEEYHAGRTDNLHDYLVPTFGDVPPIEVHLIEDAEPLGPHGAKGVGEPALIATAPAIFGAIRHATGVTVRHAPATPDRLRAWIKASAR